MLSVQNIEVMYQGVIRVLRGISLEVNDHQIVALLGANGAGKTTTLRAVSGLLHIEEGAVTSGSVLFDGRHIENQHAEDLAGLGIVQVMEGRRTFQHLTVEENLLVGERKVRRLNGHTTKWTLDKVWSYFPRLREIRHRTAGYLSGGEQQMLVIGRALVAQPRIMLLDEPSLGLSPMLVKEVFQLVKRINAEDGMPILVVEQNARAALEIAEYGYVLEDGKVVLDGTAASLRENEDIKEFYLGLSELGQAKSYRDVKHYKRRRRWLG